MNKSEAIQELNKLRINTRSLHDFSAKQLAVMNFAYFVANFPYDFIERAFPGDSVHIRAKLEHYRDLEKAGYITFNVFMNFFFNLDLSNQMILIAWIEQNYHYSSIHKSN